MKLSPNTRYAIRLLFELKGSEQPASTAYLSEKTGIALRTVETIHAVLRQGGVTAGTVGAKGGITLIQPLETISLGRLIELLDNGVEFAVCCGEKSNECPNQKTCPIRAVWNAVSFAVQKQLNAVSLDAILHQYPLENGVTALNKMLPRGGGR